MKAFITDCTFVYICLYNLETIEEIMDSINLMCWQMGKQGGGCNWGCGRQCRGLLQMESRLGLKGIKASLHMIVCLSVPSLLLLSLSMGISIKSSGLGANIALHAWTHLLKALEVFFSSLP